MLALPDRLILLDHGAQPDVVLGVPHHAPVGVDRIALERPQGGRIADENAILYALVCFTALARHGIGTRLAVASQARDHDPNKDGASPYCRAALPERARILIECHGAGARAPHDLELSAGRNPCADPLRLGRALAAALGAGFSVAAQTRPGTAHAMLLDSRGCESPTVLRFPALGTHSLLEAGARGIAALHLEAKLRFRSAGPRNGSPTPSGERLGRALADSLASHLNSAPR
ncbi:MAG TPA: hypothetical protein VKH41_04120 [Myxococcota bacterium]|nr:hypothetical protein [Myxococcota bacterium]